MRKVAALATALTVTMCAVALAARAEDIDESDLPGSHSIWEVTPNDDRPDDRDAATDEDEWRPDGTEPASQRAVREPDADADLDVRDDDEDHRRDEAWIDRRVETDSAATDYERQRDARDRWDEDGSYDDDWDRGDRSDDRPRGAGTRVEEGMSRAGDATRDGLDDAGDATDRGLHATVPPLGRGLDVALDATGRGLDRAITATGSGLRTALDWTGGLFQRAGTAMRGESSSN